ncbi:MAG: TPM domain-containing protein [Microgenomates group bacterium]
MRTIWLSFLFFIFSLSQVFAQNIPNPTSYVNDYANVLSDQFEAQLDQQISDFQKKTSIEIAVVTVASLDGTTVDDYAVKLFEKWGIGQAKKDNGLLFLIAPNEKKVRLEVGYGLEGTITDGRAGNILDTQVLPEFKKNDYEAGVKNGVDVLISYLNDPSSIPATTSDLPSESTITWLMIILFSGLPIYFLSYLSRSREITTGAIVGGLIGYLIYGFIFAIILGIFGLILDLILSRNYKKFTSMGLSTSFWKSRGGFGGGGGGFGGFGGGGSGGGGSSRGW